ncbi:hypothetical protein CKALI_01190 [Corynebacterium kalinowskii]|uniref:Uncharacterized protein n=1 Tax=Corynebacterium kalinowskii TaxID=2675216 RepID=A0A6B8W046_9CORY|nr:hypothetical protein [Corynebacterium kalinowskii]QGU01138.1 hypothetical protein CKALI_01190 [Corynebacterium kalinowskii]
MIKNLIKPSAIAALIMIALSCVFAPMIGMKPANIPVAVVAPAASPFVVALEQNPLLEATVVDQRPEIADYYAIYEPGPDGIHMDINQGKHPMVSQLLDAAAKANPKIIVSYTNPIPSDLGLAGSFLPALFVLLTFIPSLIGSVLLARGVKGLGKRLAALLTMNLIVGLVGIGIFAVLSPISVPYLTTFLFLTFASFVVGSLSVGSIALFGKAGIAIPALTLISGMGFMSLPKEFVPAFWRDWIYPWNPIRMIAESGREILYMGSGPVTSTARLLCIVAAIGLVFLFVGAMRAPRGAEA